MRLEEAGERAPGEGGVDEDLDEGVRVRVRRWRRELGGGEAGDDADEGLVGAPVEEVVVRCGD